MTEHDLRLIEIGEKAGAEKATKQIVEWLRSDRIVVSMDGSAEDVIARAIEAGEHLQ